ncbi:unnamed protein product [Thlaspi arvense]|uniref:FKB95-like N-terminal Kelch domain-containing protein n=1 Tax=Thlaspi arvense TaxID=13288 RepID=A0AAU9TA23_THLAR|nr:unnamed protein product [Thlaspi arvense]
MAPLDLEKDWHSYLVIDNVLYCYSKNSGEIKWYDTKSHYWVYMTGLEGLPTLSSCSSIELADYGGKLAVLWTRYFLSEETGYEGTRVSCAVVVLERRGEENIWGTVEWLDTAVTVPDFYRLECRECPKLCESEGDFAT